MRAARDRLDRLARPAGASADAVGQRGEQRRGDRGLEVPPRQPGQAVLERDRLALLGELEPAVDGVRRLGEDRGVRRAAAAPRAAAPAVEDGQLDAALAREPGERLLRPEDLPLGRDDAAVLARVGVADHHLEPRARRCGRGAPRRAAAAPRRSSIVSSSGTTSTSSPASRGERLGREDVVGRPGHRDDQRVDRLRAPRRAWSAAASARTSRTLVRVVAQRARVDAGGRATARGGRTRRGAARSSASPPSAMRAPPWARRLVLDEVELAAQLVDRPRSRRRRAAPRSTSAAVGTARRVRLAPAGRRRRRGVRLDQRRRHPPRRGERADVAPEELAHERGAPLHRLAHRRRARVRVPVAGRRRSRCRTGAARPAAAPRQAASRSAAASQRLSSRNQSPCRISSTTRGRSSAPRPSARGSSPPPRARASTRSPLGGREPRVVELVEQLARCAGASPGSSAAAPRWGGP